MSINFQVISAKALEVHNLDRRFHPWHDSFEQVSTLLASVDEMLLFSPRSDDAMQISVEMDFSGYQLPILYY